jgi:DNA-binding transcriptional LysR family regulator
MPHGLDDGLLRSFVAVAETGSFTAAAQRVHRSQSAISQQMRRLEEIAGAALLHRDSRQVALSDQGEVFLAYARRLLRLQDEALAAVNDRARPYALRVGMPDDYAEAVLPRILPAFAARHPNVRPHVHCTMSSQLLRRMAAGELDLAITIRHAGQGSGQATGETIRQEELAWVAGPDYADAPDAPLPLALFPEGCPYRARGINALLQAGRDWQLIYTTQSPTGIRIAVERQGAVTVNATRTTPANWRVMGPPDGLPELPTVDLELHRAPTAPAQPTEDFVELLTETLAAPAAADP